MDSSDVSSSIRRISRIRGSSSSSSSSSSGKRRKVFLGQLSVLEQYLLEGVYGVRLLGVYLGLREPSQALARPPDEGD